MAPSTFALRSAQVSLYLALPSVLVACRAVARGSLWTPKAVAGCGVRRVVERGADQPQPCSSSCSKPREKCCKSGRRRSLHSKFRAERDRFPQIWSRCLRVRDREAPGSNPGPPTNSRRPCLGRQKILRIGADTSFSTHPVSIFDLHESCHPMSSQSTLFQPGAA